MTLHMLPLWYHGSITNKSSNKPGGIKITIMINKSVRNILYIIGKNNETVHVQSDDAVFCEK